MHLSSTFRWASAVLVFGSLVLVIGCGSLSIPEAPPRSTPIQPLWSDEAFLEHLRFFNGSEVEGRATGTVGYATAASYVAARMGEFGLQPALAHNAQVIYPTAINAVQSATLTELNGDTLAFYLGIDYLPDGRSDSGRVDIHTLTLDPAALPEGSPVSAGPAVLLASDRASTAYLQQLRDAGARVAFLMGPLVPHPAAAPVRGLLVVHVLPEVAPRFLRTSRGALASYLAGKTRLSLPLPQPLRVQVGTQMLAYTGAINVMGYVAGKHPTRANELVIVCSDLDAVGTFAGMPTLDTAHLGVGTATLLEVAHQYANFGQFTSVPERTLLFAVFSGSRQGNAGLRAYLRQPFWPLDHTRAVIYVGLDPADEPAVRDLLAAYGLTLYVVTPSTEAPGARGVVLLPSRRPPRQRSLLAPDEAAPRRDPPRLADLIDAGVVQAREMAEKVNTLLLRKAVTGASVVPVNADTLVIPNGR